MTDVLDSKPFSYQKRWPSPRRVAAVLVQTVLAIVAVNFTAAGQQVDPASPVGRDRSGLPIGIRAQTQDAASRIAEVDAWQKIHGSPLRAKMEAHPNAEAGMSPPSRIVRSMPVDLSPAQRANTEELDGLNQEFADAVRTMRTHPRTPAQQVRVFDEFQRVNREALADQRSQRMKLSTESAALPAVESPLAATQTPEEAQKRESLQLIKARQTAYNRLPPAERIAAFDSEASFSPSLLRRPRPIPSLESPSENK